MEEKTKKILEVCADNKDFKNYYSQEHSLFKNLSFLLDGGHQRRQR